MQRFIAQFRKAKETKSYLLYDNKEQRYMVTKNKNWLKWCVLIKKF